MAITHKITPENVERLDRLVATGDYPSRDAVVAASLDSLEREGWAELVNAKASESAADVAAGRVYDADEVFDELIDRNRKWQR